MCRYPMRVSKLGHCHVSRTRQTRKWSEFRATRPTDPFYVEPRLWLHNFTSFSLNHTTIVMSVHPLLGKPIPTLSLPNAEGSTYELKPVQGKPMAIFFYPKAGTLSCSPAYSLHVSRILNVAQVPLAVQEKFAVSGMRSPVCHTLISGQPLKP
jgi:AhpC/TSA family